MQGLGIRVWGLTYPSSIWSWPALPAAAMSKSGGTRLGGAGKKLCSRWTELSLVLSVASAFWGSKGNPRVGRYEGKGRGKGCREHELRMTVDGQVVDVGAGESVVVRGGEVHAFANPFEETAKLLCVLTPGVFGVQYFREIRELMAQGGPPDPKKAAEIMMRHGLVPVRPS